MKVSVDHQPMRIDWVDYAKGIGIILVVLAHVIRGLRSEMLGSRLYDYVILDTAIYSFHMPLFFLISGFLFGQRRKTSATVFFHSLLIGLVVPYVIWTVAFVLLQNLVISEVNNPYELAVLPHIWRSPVAHMWFLYALFFLQVAFFAAIMLLGRLGGILLTILAVASCFVLAIGHFFSWVAPGTPMGGIFFGLGLAVSSMSLLLRASRRNMACVVVVGALAWIVLLLLGLNWREAVDAVSVLTVMVAAAGVAMTVAFCMLLPEVRNPFLATLALLGKASLAIYVMHTIFAAALRIALYRNGIFDGDLHIIGGTLVGVALPTVFFVIANKFEISPYVGLGKLQRDLLSNFRTHGAQISPTGN